MDLDDDELRATRKMKGLEKTADEMFEKLGYTKWEGLRTIEYKKENNLIIFYKDFEGIAKQKVEVVVFFTMQELKAIIKKCKELRMDMKQAMINYIKTSKNDELYTPREAIYPILKYLDKTKIYWECTDTLRGRSNIKKVLEENGFNVISTNKNDLNFLVDDADFKYDIIITNPPYSLKNDFLKRCYEINKPFLLLLPITALEGKERGKMYKENGLELVVLNKRINFMQEQKNVWFNTSWFCHNICEKQLNFEEVL